MAYRTRVKVRFGDIGRADRVPDGPRRILLSPPGPIRGPARDRGGSTSHIVVAVDLATLKPTRIPERLCEAFERAGAEPSARSQAQVGVFPFPLRMTRFICRNPWRHRHAWSLVRAERNPPGPENRGELTGLSGRSTFSLMITGHNTDVEYAGRIYHVQTEDKGRSNPVIESLIYSRGEILDSRRSSYADAIKDGYDEKMVIRLIEQQHGRMLREVRNGRFDPEGPKPFGWNLITSRELDEVVLEWLASDRGGLGLRIELSDAYTFFRGQRRRGFDRHSHGRGRETGLGGQGRGAPAGPASEAGEALRGREREGRERDREVPDTRSQRRGRRAGLQGSPRGNGLGADPPRPFVRLTDRGPWK